MNKRLLKEIQRLTIEQQHKPLLENDYLIELDETNTNIVHAIIKCPYESVYRHKFIRLKFNLPQDYPHSPPVVTFINYDGIRIHPNMYEDGKCCSTILNTWPSDNEKWTSSMGIETVLLAFHSFFDNNPYTYEPGGRDDTSYTEYVLHQSWITCLIRYIHDESQSELFTTFINNYLLTNVDNIFNELTDSLYFYPYGNMYTRCFEIDDYIIDYESIIFSLEQYYQYIEYRENFAIENEELDYTTFINKEYTCNICFDTTEYDTNQSIVLSCKHSFHVKCINTHIKNNGSICSLCRSTINTDDLNNITDSCTLRSLKRSLDEWIINPETNRRIKIGGKTYKKLIEDGTIVE